MSNWSYAPPMGIASPGAPVRANGGAGAQALTFRTSLDGARTPMGQRVPAAEYPDGYLGTIQSRREDRLLDNIKARSNQRPYQRGVHKGERIDPGDYYWPENLRPDVALTYQAQGLRWTQAGTFVERLVNGGKNPTLSPAEIGAAAQGYGLDNPGLTQIDPVRTQRMARLLPGWR